jgi:hypothetical protein
MRSDADRIHLARVTGQPEEWIMIPAPPIVSPALWEKAQIKPTYSRSARDGHATRKAKLKEIATES